MAGTDPKIPIRPFDLARYAGKSPSEIVYMTMGALNILSCLGSRMSDREVAAAARRGSKWIMEHFSQRPDSIKINFKKGTARKG